MTSVEAQPGDARPRPDGRTVVVGVDGSPEGTEALRYAAGVAHLQTMRLLVVHAYELPPHLSVTTAAVLGAAALASAYQVTADALSEIHLPAGVEVAAAVELSTPVLMLQRLSGQVAMIVLGQHLDDPSDSVLAGPVTSTVAAGASCPVVIVPADWSRDTSPSRAIVVGMDGHPGSRVVLRYAFAEAERRHWPLLALRALPVGMTPFQASVESARLGDLLSRYRHHHPGVRATGSLVEGDLAQVILSAARGTRLLVVGRPTRHSRPGAWPHSAARQVMRQLPCPLAVVPQSAREPAGRTYQS